MKKFIFILLMFSILIISSIPVFAAESEQLMQAYKDQHDAYTAEIKELESSIANHKDYLIKLSEINSKIQQLDMKEGRATRQGRDTGNQVVESARQLKIKEDRLKEVSDKKRDLKIKILEKNGKLPSWWNAPQDK